MSCDDGSVVKTFKVTAITRLVDLAFAAATKAGRGAPYRYVLTVRGRRSGQDRSVPVDVMDVHGELHLVAPYGVVAWVHNVRAAREVTLSRGGRSTRYRPTAVHGPEAVPVIRQYIRTVPVTRPYWEVGEDASDEQILAVLDRHPVFRLMSQEE